MKAILITDEPKWCRLMMNGDKTVEARKGDKLYKATQKLIDEYGYAQFYVCCSKAKHIKDYLQIENGKYVCNVPKDYESELNGKVAFKFRCYDVEEIYYGGEYKQFDPYTACYYTNKLIPIYLKHRTCLDYEELSKYLNGYERLKGKRGAVGTAIHISYLEIFDKPKELNEFYKVGAKEEYEHIVSIDETQAKPYIDEFYKLTKAPQSFCYVETGEWKE